MVSVLFDLLRNLYVVMRCHWHYNKKNDALELDNYNNNLHVGAIFIKLMFQVPKLEPDPCAGPQYADLRVQIEHHCEKPESARNCVKSDFRVFKTTFVENF